MLSRQVTAIEKQIVERRHYDRKIEDLDLTVSDMRNGNGKPGWLVIRDKFLGWETKANAIIVLVVGDAVLRIIQLMYK